jgi:hypothetical protein
MQQSLGAERRGEVGACMNIRKLVPVSTICTLLLNSALIRTLSNFSAKPFARLVRVIIKYIRILRRIRNLDSLFGGTSDDCDDHPTINRHRCMDAETGVSHRTSMSPIHGLALLDHITAINSVNPGQTTPCGQKKAL